MRYEPLLVRWLTRLLGDRESARDIAQSTFLKVWLFSRDQHVAYPKRFVFLTASRLVLDEQKRRRRFSRRFVFSEDIPETAVSRNDVKTPSPEEQVQSRQESRRILGAIDELSPNVRTAFLLQRIERLTYAQIAARMGVSKSSVEKYMMAALKQLRKSVLEDDNQPSGARKRADSPEVLFTGKRKALRNVGR